MSRQPVKKEEGGAAQQLHPMSPNTVTDMLLTSAPTILTQTQPPYYISAVNQAWTRLCGFTSEEVVSKATPAILHSYETDRARAKEFARELQHKGTATATITNQAKDGTCFTHTITGERMIAGGVEHFAARSSNVTILGDSGATRRQRNLRLLALLALLCTTILVVASPSDVSSNIATSTASPPPPRHRGHLSRAKSEVLDPVRMRMPEQGSARRRPMWQPNALQASVDRAGRTIGGAIRRLVPLGGFVTITTLVNCDMLLIFSGAALVSGF